MTRGSESDFDPALGGLAAFVAGASFEAIPASAVEREKRHVLDTLGCILYGSTTPWVGKVVRAFAALGESGSATALGSGASLPPARAVLANGTAAHSMDYDDHCQEAGVHAGSATVPTALAVAETADRPVTGREFLTAVTAGVEAGIRSGFGIGYGSVGRGWHIAGWTGAFAGAATTAALVGLDDAETGHALAVAGTQGCGLLGAQYGAEVKRFHMGKAAESGYLGAALAAEGFTGDTGIFADRYGAIGPTMSDDYDVPAVTDGLGDEYRLLDKLSFKPFPGVGQVHAAVDALREIMVEHDLDPDGVEHVRVRTTETVKDHVGWEYEPTDVMSAQSNIGYAIAALLVDGDLTIEAYTPEAIGRPEVVARTDDVEVVVDRSLPDETFGSVVEATAGGETYENAVHTPRGYPENPMTDDELVGKFRTQAGAVLPADAIDRVVEFVLGLDERDDVTELFGLLS